MPVNCHSIRLYSLSLSPPLPPLVPLPATTAYTFPARLAAKPDELVTCAKAEGALGPCQVLLLVQDIRERPAGVSIVLEEEEVELVERISIPLLPEVVLLMPYAMAAMEAVEERMLLSFSAW